MPQRKKAIMDRILYEAMMVAKSHPYNFTEDQVLGDPRIGLAVSRQIRRRLKNLRRLHRITWDMRPETILRRMRYLHAHGKLKCTTQ